MLPRLKSWGALEHSLPTAKAMGWERWHGQKDLNPRPTVLETVALPAELCPCVVWYRKVKHPTRGEMLNFQYPIVIVEKFLYASVTCI
jgi:hypothetical protein